MAFPKGIQKVTSTGASVAITGPTGPTTNLEISPLWGITTVSAPTGVVATDTANVQTAINAVSALGGGTVQLQPGLYKVTSSSRIDATVSYTGSGVSYTWTDAAIVSADVGSYLTGIGIEGRAPKIVSVTNGVGFVTDIAPVGAISAGAITVGKPGVLMPEGVILQGVGGSIGGALVLTGGTQIYDNGNGDTVLSRGGTPTVGGFYFSRSKIKDLSLWGSPGGATIGSTRSGVWVNANSLFFEVDGCDIAGHRTYGLALDYNNNNLDVRNTSFRNSGNVANTNQGGGVILDPFNGYVSANINFYNCAWQGIVGFGVCGVSQNPVTLDSCQWNGTQNSAAYQSGTSVFIQGSTAVMTNCWSESAANLDIFVSYGVLTLVGGNMNSPNAYGILVGNNCQLTIIGTEFTGHTIASLDVAGPGNTVSWVNPSVLDPLFMAGVPGGGGIGGIGDGTTGVYITPSVTVSVTSNAGTVPITSSLNKFTNSSAAAMTITLAVTGAVDGQTTTVRVYDFSAFTQTIAWVGTENSTVTAPVISNGSTTLPKTVGFMFNAATSLWRCVLSV